jgi:hypothetical protein
MENSPQTLALFGSSQKGAHNEFFFHKSLLDLWLALGEPPSETEGLYFAIQAILYGKSVLFFRVAEEGENNDDYHKGLQLLRDNSSSLPPIGALFLPKVGSHDIIEEGLSLCRTQHSLLLMKEADFYDWATDYKFARHISD